VRSRRLNTLSSFSQNLFGGQRRGCVNVITENFIVTFNDKDRYEKNFIALGLNNNNLTSKISNS